MASDGPELTDEEIFGLTDAELLERNLLLTAASDNGSSEANRQAEAEFLSHPTIESLLRVRLARKRVSVRNLEIRRLQAEIARRLGSMLKSARLARGLSVRDVLARSGDSRSSPQRLAQVERGVWWLANPPFFERACSPGGLNPTDGGLRRSFWFPLLEHPYCRTIRDVAIDPAWLTWNDGASLALARSIREGRAFDLLPVLGDALEEAGCADASILDHCRNPGLHLMSCWVVDALVRTGRPK